MVPFDSPWMVPLPDTWTSTRGTGWLSEIESCGMGVDGIHHAPGDAASNSASGCCASIRLAAIPLATSCTYVGAVGSTCAL